MAPLAIPPVHPKDKNLLRPLSELGKPKHAPGGYSFLRRTEYISSEQSRPRPDSSIKTPSKTFVKPRKPADTSNDEPINILRSAIKGFDVAYPHDAYTGPDTEENIRGAVPSPAELEAWNNPKHPSNPELKLVDRYPLLPDLDAMTDSASYMVVKFAANPTSSTDKRDTRMDVGVLHALEISPEVLAEWKAKVTAHDADPAHHPHPGGVPYSYNLFLPADEVTADNLSTKLDVDDPDKDDPELCARKDKDGSGSIRLNQVRIYDTGRQSGTPEFPYKEVALAIHDPELEEKAPRLGVEGGKPARGRLKKAAYYYPVAQKLQLKPRRNKNLVQLGLAAQAPDDEENKVDVMDLTVREPDEVEESRRSGHRMDLDIQTEAES